MKKYRYSRWDTRIRWFIFGVIMTAAVVGGLSLADSEKVIDVVEKISDDTYAKVETPSTSDEKSSSVKPDLTINDPMEVTDMWGYNFGEGLLGGTLKIELKPTQYLQYDVPYTVNLRYDGYILTQKQVTWRKGEPVKTVNFNIDPGSSSLIEIARGKDVDDVFSVNFWGP